MYEFEGKSERIQQTRTQWLRLSDRTGNPDRLCFIVIPIPVGLSSQRYLITIEKPFVACNPLQEKHGYGSATPRLLTSRRCWLHLILVAYKSWQLCMYKISQSESLRAMPNMIMSTMNFSFVKPAPTAGKKCQPQAWDTLVNSRENANQFAKFQSHDTHTAGTGLAGEHPKSVLDGWTFVPNL